MEILDISRSRLPDDYVTDIHLVKKELGGTIELVVGKPRSLPARIRDKRDCDSPEELLCWLGRTKLRDASKIEKDYYNKRMSRMTRQDKRLLWERNRHRFV